MLTVSFIEAIESVRDTALNAYLVFWRQAVELVEKKGASSPDIRQNVRDLLTRTQHPNFAVDSTRIRVCASSWRGALPSTRA